MNYYRIFVILPFLFLSFNFSTAQPVEIHSTQRYSELNGGIAFNRVLVNNNPVGPPIYPGVSFLWGKTHYFKSGFLLDNEIGLALPVIFTAKIGAGIDFEKFEFLIGLRAIPFNYYIQINTPTERGSFLFSVEKNILKFRAAEFSPPVLINIGYRWIKF